jgi:tetratricopeptide (TPR) repeat protein
MTDLRVENLTIPGAPLGGENPLPFFRDPAINREIRVTESMPLAKQEYLGWETAFRVLPYRMQDQYTRQREPLTFHSIVLENEILKATFLPEVGGRLISLFHKPIQRELLHRNPVFQPANLAIRNAWFSGGIEWNIGQLGHTFTTCSPLFASAIQGAQGEPGLRLYEFERCKSLFWQIDFYLPPGFPFLVAYTRVVNPNPADTSMYWWTNIAVNEAPDVRVLAPALNAIYINFNEQGSGFGYAAMPNLPSIKGADGTYSMNFPFASEFFFQCDQAEVPWEAALDGEGRGLIEASTRRLKYRKMFCWGSHAGGRHWQEFLSQPGQAYIEIQAGLAPTQVHGLVMPGRTAWDWTQVFGYLEANPAEAHSPDWECATRAVDAALKARIPPQALSDLEETYRSRADIPSQNILQAGSGWGALELTRRQRDPAAMPLPAAFVFPQVSMGTEQEKWLHLLDQGVLPHADPAEAPGEWMTQPEWRILLEHSLGEKRSRDSFALLHLGVMRMENLDEEGAASAWEESIQVRPSACAYRNLAVLRLRQKQDAEALQLYEKAWHLADQSDVLQPALAVEYLHMLVNTRQYRRGLEVLQSLPARIQETDRIQLLWAQIALELGMLDKVEQILGGDDEPGREFAVIQEGQTLLTDLWFELQARKISFQTGEPLSEKVRRKVKLELVPPRRIDFRSHNSEAGSTPPSPEESPNVSEA